MGHVFDQLIIEIPADAAQPQWLEHSPTQQVGDSLPAGPIDDLSQDAHREVGIELRGSWLEGQAMRQGTANVGFIGMLVGLTIPPGCVPVRVSGRKTAAVSGQMPDGYPGLVPVSSVNRYSRQIMPILLEVLKNGGVDGLENKSDIGKDIVNAVVGKD